MVVHMHMANTCIWMHAWKPHPSEISVANNATTKLCLRRIERSQCVSVSNDIAGVDRNRGDLRETWTREH